MRLQSIKGVALAGLLLLAGACQDLDVNNPNAPDRDRALAQPGDVEAFLGGTWVTWWRRVTDLSAVYYTFPTVADEGTATYANGASLELSSEPRVPFNNNPTADAHDMARFPWGDFNEMVANANDVLAAIEDGLEIVIQGVDYTERDKLYAKFIQGLGLGYLSLIFDRAYIVDESTDLENLEPTSHAMYPEVREAAIEKMEEAIELAAAAQPFELPFDWMYMNGVDNQRLAQIAHSFIVRFLVYGARTPEERENLDWDRVLYHLDRGITEDYAPIMSPETIDGFYWNFIQRNTSFAQHADYKLIGPSDVSGNYQAWLAADLSNRQPFQITTPDRRITGPGGPTDDGKYFEYRSTIPFTESRGIYHFSHYQWDRRGGDYRNGPAQIMTVDEMRLIHAEAMYHTGMFQEAADLINVTRVANGELPPVTAAGVPDATDCVPRPQEDPAGPCGSLWDALHFERLIEGAGLDGVKTYLDRRGFGSLAKGTFLHLPVPGRELESLGLPIYTFGGVGGEWAAQ